MTKMKRDKKIENVWEAVLNTYQACNEFQLRGVIRAHVNKKYKGWFRSVSEWSEIFRKDGIS